MALLTDQASLYRVTSVQQYICMRDGPRTSVIDLLGSAAYLQGNRTRPASVRKDMHTGRVFCFGGPGFMYQRA